MFFHKYHILTDLPRRCLVDPKACIKLPGYISYNFQLRLTVVKTEDNPDFKHLD